MANLKVFVSSTCYDLHAIRSQLRSLLSSTGYEPVMSEHADVIYDPRIHTHLSCLREVENCDVVVLVVGSRFGGAIVPKALEVIDLDHLRATSRADQLDEKSKISITQAEVLQAIQTGIPVFAFVDAGVMRDHLTYEKNKNKSIIGQIDFSSIEKSETAPYIFEFINFLRLRNENNSVFEFTRFEDIESQLKRQWAGLFQRLLHEQREKAAESRRIDVLSSQIADLKAAVLSSISSRELKETAKGAIKYRNVIELAWSLCTEAHSAPVPGQLNYELSFNELLKSLGIVEVKADESRGRLFSMTTALLRKDGTYFRARVPVRVLPKLAREWDEFRQLRPDTRDAILNAVLDGRDARPVFTVRHVNEPYVEGGSVSRDDDTDLEVFDVLGKVGVPTVATTDPQV